MKESERRWGEVTVEGGSEREHTWLWWGAPRCEEGDSLTAEGKAIEVTCMAKKWAGPKQVKENGSYRLPGME